MRRLFAYVQKKPYLCRLQYVLLHKMQTNETTFT